MAPIGEHWLRAKMANTKPHEWDRVNPSLVWAAVKDVLRELDKEREFVDKYRDLCE